MALLNFQTGLLDCRPILVVIHAQESGEFLRAVAYRVAALTYQARANFRCVDMCGSMVRLGGLVMNKV